MAYRFNPAPGWPAPPEGWTPPEGWQPDPAWPPAPEGWEFWVWEEDASAMVRDEPQQSESAPGPISSEPLPPAGVPPVGQTPPPPQQADVPDSVDSSAPQHDPAGEKWGQFHQAAQEPAPAPEPATDPLPPVVPPVSETPPQQWGHPQPPASPASGWEHPPAPQAHAW